MQKEHVHDVSRPHDSGDDAEQATDEARDGERDEVIRARHVRRPDLACKGADETPEDDRTAADEAGKRRKQEWTSHPPGERGGDGVEKVGLRLSVCRDLEDEGELVGVGRHLAREAGEADTCENNDLLSDRPVLCPSSIYKFSILHVQAIGSLQGGSQCLTYQRVILIVAWLRDEDDVFAAPLLHSIGRGVKLLWRWRHVVVGRRDVVLCER